MNKDCVDTSMEVTIDNLTVYLDRSIENVVYTMPKRKRVDWQGGGKRGRSGRGRKRGEGRRKKKMKFVLLRRVKGNWEHW